jgi:hypothetical protein
MNTTNLPGHGAVPPSTRRSLPKCRSISTRLYATSSQKTDFVIVAAVRIWSRSQKNAPEPGSRLPPSGTLRSNIGLVTEGARISKTSANFNTTRRYTPHKAVTFTVIVATGSNWYETGNPMIRRRTDYCHDTSVKGRHRDACGMWAQRRTACNNVSAPQENHTVKLRYTVAPLYITRTRPTAYRFWWDVK